MIEKKYRNYVLRVTGELLPFCLQNTQHLSIYQLNSQDKLFIVLRLGAKKVKW